MSEHANSLQFSERSPGFLKGSADLEALEKEAGHACECAALTSKLNSCQYQEEEAAAEYKLQPIVLIEAASPLKRLQPLHQTRSLQPMSRQQKLTLADNIQALAPQHIPHITDLVREHRRPSAANRFEFDLDTLPLHLCYELKQYVNKCKRQRKKKILVQLSDSESSNSEEGYL